MSVFKFTRTRLVLLVVTIFLGLIFYFAYSLFWFGGLGFSGIEDFETVQIDGNDYAAKSLTGDLRLRPGTHEVQVYGPLYRPLAQTVDVKPFDHTILSIDVRKLTEQEVLNYISGNKIPDGFQLGGGSLLENNYWAVLLINSIDGTQEGWVDIYKFNGKHWQLVESGTGLDKEYLNELGAPDSINEYLESVNE